MNFNELINKALVANEQSERSEYLTNISEDYGKLTSSLKTTEGERDNLIEENKRLKDQNLNLFTKVSQQELPINKEQTTKNEDTVDAFSIFN